MKLLHPSCAVPGSLLQVLTAQQPPLRAFRDDPSRGMRDPGRRIYLGFRVQRAPELHAR